jgi:dipeptidyl aminopeptidase/acylaminoacyl peptidase
MKPAHNNRLWLFALILAIVNSSISFAQPMKRAMTVDDVMRLRAVSDPRISPDGRLVAFVVTQADMKTNFRNSDVWLVAAEGGDPRPLTGSPRRDDAPQWSPDAKRLAFISDRDGRAQVYSIRIDGGEPQRITDVKTAVQSFAWSPDGKRIAYIAADPVSEMREKEKKDGFDQIVVDADYPFAHISVIDVPSSANSELPKPSKLTDGAWHVAELEWSPDSTLIAFTARNTPKLADSPSTEIYLIDAAPPEVGPLTLSETRRTPQITKDNNRTESNIAWSPDGTRLSYLSPSDKYPAIGPSRVHLIDAAGLKRLHSGRRDSPLVWLPLGPLQPQFDGYITRHEWSHDGQFVYFTADAGVQRHLYRVSSDGKALEPLINDEGLQGTFSLSEKTDRIAYLKEDPTRPADVWVASINAGAKGNQIISNARQLTRMNPQADGFALGRVEIIRWKSSKDGREIEGVLVYPMDYDASKRYPLITSIHGGPEGAYTQSFMASYSEFPHLYAARGYASFFPNFRGSSNYGAEFASANVGDLGGGDYEDILSGVDYLIGRGIADLQRLVIKGYSYGGYMSGWIIGHTARFKAAVFGAGLANAVSYYSTADIQWSRETLHQGTPWRNNQNMIERSPVFYLQNAKTPSLIFHGEKDERVPLGQSQETYMGLKKAGVPTQLVIYPREGHGLREPAHQLDKMRREIDWFEKYLSGV